VLTFNTSKVRLEGAACTSSTRLGTSFNTSKVRLEAGLRDRVPPRPNLFQYLEGAIRGGRGARRAHSRRPFNTSKVRLEVAETMADAEQRILLSIPRRCD